MRNRIGKEIMWMALLAVLLLVAAVVIPVAASTLSDNNLNISVYNKTRDSLYAKDGVTYYDDYNETYYFYIGGGAFNGGQNTPRITDNNATPNGVIHTGSDLNGSFFISDTGGKGYLDEAILLIAVNESVPSNFTLHLTAAGYKFASHAPSSSPNESQVGVFNSNAFNYTFTASNFLKSGTSYIKQNTKPGTDSIDNINRMLFNGEDELSEPDYHLIFVDLNTSVVGTNAYNASYRANLTYNGFPKVTYNISTLGDQGRIAFVPYGWVNYTTGGGSGYFDRTIGWTSRVTTSSWLVNMTPV